MGMELVELVLELERRFDVVLDDKELSRVVTVGDLNVYLQRIVPTAETKVAAPCVTSIAFFRLRKAITAVKPKARTTFRPAAMFGDVLSPRETRRFWKRIGRESGLELPPLVRNARVTRILICGVLALALVVSTATFLFGSVSFGEFLLTLFAGGLFFGIVAAVSTQFLRRHPARCELSVGEWVRRVAADNFGRIRRESGIAIGKDEIFAIVRTAVAETSGVDESEIKPESRLVRDLGME